VVVLLILLLVVKEFAGKTPAYKSNNFWRDMVGAGLVGNHCVNVKTFATRLGDRTYLLVTMHLTKPQFISLT
jgi:hypothetical protein